MEYPDSPEELVECADCGDTMRARDAKKVMDGETTVCRSCYEMYDPDL